MLAIGVALALVSSAAGAAATRVGAGIDMRAKASATRHGLLFRLDYPGRAPSFVFGTLHSADPRVTAVAAQVADAMARARTLAVEVDLGPGDVRDFFLAAQLPAGQQLADWLPPATISAVEHALAPGLDPAALRRLKPWAVFLKLAEDAPTGAESLDALLRDAARARHMTVLGLELPEEQIAALDSIPVASQVALVEYVLRDPAALARDHEAAVRAWLAGDLRTLARIADAPGRRDRAVVPHFAALRAALIDGRTALLAHRLFVPLRGGAVFVAVGASHLDGPQGLLALLRQQGYRATALR